MTTEVEHLKLVTPQRTEPAKVYPRVVGVVRDYGWWVLAGLFLWLSIAGNYADRRESDALKRRVEALERLHEAPAD